MYGGGGGGGGMICFLLVGLLVGVRESTSGGRNWTSFVYSSKDCGFALFY